MKNKFLIIFLCFFFFLSLQAQNTAKKQFKIDSVIAIINDDIITMSDLQRSLMPLIKQLKGNFTGKELNSKIIEASKTVLQQLIENKLILQTAKGLKDNEGFKVSEKEIQQRIKYIIDRFPSKTIFEETLRKENLSFEDFKKDCMEQILAQRLIMKEVSAKVFVSNEDIKEFYDTNIDTYTTPAKSTFYQIWLKKDGTDSDKKDILTTILKKINDGEDFKALAIQYSEGPHAKEGGIWKDVVKGQFMKELDTAIWKLSPAQISPIIETKVSFHIVKVDYIEKPNIIPLKEVWDKIKSKIRAEKGEKIRKKWINTLKKDSFIQIFFDPGNKK